MSGAVFDTARFDRTLAQPAMPAASPAPVLLWLVTVVSVGGILLTNSLSTIGAAAFVATWPLAMLRQGRLSAAALTATPILWAYPCFVIASCLWSTDRSATLRYGAEYFLTVAGAVLAARLQPPRALASALTVCMLLVAAASVVFGKSEVDPLTGTTSFVGLFGSKNMVGLLASMMLLLALALLCEPRVGWLTRIVALMAIAADGPLLYVSKSGTSFVTTAIAVFVFGANLGLSRLDRHARARVLFAVFVTLLPIVAMVGFAGDLAQDFIVNVMGKDTTLTGRTVLWQHAATLIPLHPIGGVGAGAFWQQNTVDAESLWHEFHVEARAGFHFHNTYIETFIELGYVGGAVLIALLAATLLRCIRWSWNDGSVMASLIVSVMLCLIIRSFVEVDTIAPFQIGTFLLWVCVSYALQPPPKSIAA
jgi:exopolysaccharide production protein ExoQ